MRQKAVRKTSTKPRYQVNVVENENVVPTFQDNGADISIMWLITAKQIKFPLTKTKAKISQYGPKPLECVRYFDGTTMPGTTVANTQIIIIKQPLQTLLSRKLSEELQILKLHPQPLLITEPLHKYYYINDSFYSQCWYYTQICV